MLAAPMPPQASHRLYLAPPSPSTGADTTPSHTIMTPAIPPLTSSHPSTVSRPNMPCCLTSNATTSQPSRPKLTLQTSSLPRTFGSSTTGLSLSLAAGSTASPTIRNTFKNAYDVVYPSSATASPSRSNTSRFSKPSSPYTSQNPYQLPLGVKSILRNSPLEPARRRSNSVAPSGSNGGPSSRRVFFPTKKQVNYRLSLEEEIKTVKYTARHSDLFSEPDPKVLQQSSSDEDSDYSTSSLVSSNSTTSDEDAELAAPSSRSSAPDGKKKKRKYRSAERQVRAVALMDGLERDNRTSSTPQTPRQNRVKRRCEWRWTLGPLAETSENKSTQPSQSDKLATAPTTTVPSTPSQSEVEIENPLKTLGGSTEPCNPPTESQEPSNPNSQPPSTPTKYESKKNTSLESERRNADPPE